MRIDADIDGALKGDCEIADGEQNELLEVIKKHLEGKAIEIQIERFKSGKVPAVINVDEFARRMSEMNEYYGMAETDALMGAKLVFNLTNPVVSSLLTLSEIKQKQVIEHIYYLALLSYKPLTPEELADFMDKSGALLFDYVK